MSVPAISAAPVEEEMPLPVEETVPVEVEAPEGAEKGHPTKSGEVEVAVVVGVFFFWGGGCFICWEERCWK